MYSKERPQNHPAPVLDETTAVMTNRDRTGSLVPVGTFLQELEAMMIYNTDVAGVEHMSVQRGYVSNIDGRRRMCSETFG